MTALSWGNLIGQWEQDVWVGVAAAALEPRGGYTACPAEEGKASEQLGEWSSSSQQRRALPHTGWHRAPRRADLIPWMLPAGTGLYSVALSGIGISDC